MAGVVKTKAKGYAAAGSRACGADHGMELLAGRTDGLTGATSPSSQPSPTRRGSFFNCKDSHLTH